MEERGRGWARLERKRDAGHGCLGGMSKAVGVVEEAGARLDVRSDEEVDQVDEQDAEDVVDNVRTAVAAEVAVAVDVGVSEEVLEEERQLQSD